jgi:arginase
MELDIVSVPFSSTGLAGGTAAAPAALHAQGLVGRVRSALPTGWTPIEPVPVRGGERSLVRNPESGLLNEQALVTMIDGVADTVSAAYAEGRFPLLLGGDGPVLLGALVAAGHRADAPAGLLAFPGAFRAGFRCSLRRRSPCSARATLARWPHRRCRRWPAAS